jgi:hypothetical protein
VAEKNREKIFKFEIYLKRRCFGAPRTEPDPTRTKTVSEFFFFFFFFFLQKTSTPGVRIQQYPSGIHTHNVPSTGTAPILPYQCFLVHNPRFKY